MTENTNGATITFKESDLIHKSPHPQRVSDNGTVSVGRSNRHKQVWVYVIEAED